MHISRERTFSARTWRAQDLSFAHLDGASLTGAALSRAQFFHASLRGAKLLSASLDGANLRYAHLEGVDFNGADLGGAQFQYAAVDGETLIGPVLDHDAATDFTGVGLRSARVEPELRAALEANVRRLKWKRWYEDHKPLAPLVWLFWQFSDYGTSTRRLITCFFGFAAIFAAILCCQPDLVRNLDTIRTDNETVVLLPAEVRLRAAYFSVVTMTTLGFGDIHAAPTSPAGHALLMLQVLVGYVLLGALVTRFAIMFQES